MKSYHRQGRGYRALRVLVKAQCALLCLAKELGWEYACKAAMSLRSGAESHLYGIDM